MTTESGKTETTESIQATPKVEFRDGAVLVDGHKVVKESDLIAAKKSLEDKLEQQQAVHVQAIDTSRLELSEAQRQIAQANVKLQEALQASKTGAISTEETAKLRTELDGAKKLVEQSGGQVLELRRTNIVLASKGTVTVDQLKEKNLSQLDAFEEALKILNKNGSPGNYMTGGGAGGAAPETPMERAARILASTPMRGTRTAETQ